MVHNPRGEAALAPPAHDAAQPAPASSDRPPRRRPQTQPQPPQVQQPPQHHQHQQRRPHLIWVLAALGACALSAALLLLLGCDPPGGLVSEARLRLARAAGAGGARECSSGAGAGASVAGADFAARVQAAAAAVAAPFLVPSDVVAVLTAPHAAQGRGPGAGDAGVPGRSSGGAGGGGGSGGASGASTASGGDGGAGPAGAAAADKQWGKECAPGCTDNGNCNREEGRCDCPWGYSGPACADRLLPACALGPNGTVAQCGELLPRSCECLRQCHKFFCGGGEGCEAHRDVEGPRCFELLAQEGGPAPYVTEGVYSAVPGDDDIIDGHPVAWYRGIGLDQEGRPLPQARRKRITREEALRLEGGVVALPQSACPGGCSLRGQCVARGGEARCACWRGYDGAACEMWHDLFCLNGCQGRGTCVGGFCHCQPGFWGADCSRSRAFPPPPSGTFRAAAPPRLRIYVYELPTDVAFDFESAAAFEFDAGFAWHHENYVAYKHFKAALSDDWAVRTEDPYEATLFFVPAESYSYSSNTGDVLPHLRRAIRHVAAAHPFFNASRGRDHILWLPNDRGACFVPPSDPILGPPIKVTHFGLSNPSAAAHPAGSDFDTAPDRRHGCHRPNRDIVAAPHFAGQAALAERTYLRAAAGGAAGGPAPAAVAGSVAAAAAGAAGGALAGGETGAAVAADSLAVAPARTMLAAEGKAAAAAAAGGAEAQGPHPPAEAGAAPAAAPEAAAAFDSITAGGDAPGDAVAGATASATDAAAGGEGGGALAFFAGDIREDDKSYSGGIRQELYRLYRSHPGVRLVTGGMAWARYEAEMRAARFCLAPYGHGWGMRLSEAVAMGCVPVIIQDGVQQPYEDLLPYEEFSIRISKPLLRQLADLLAAVTPARHAQLKEGLRRHWRAFVWDSAKGGRAYNVTIAALDRRATSVLGGQYL